MTLSCEKKFKEIFGKDRSQLAFCPYRVCPIGAHSDGNLGKITGLTINHGIHLAWSPLGDDTIDLVSLQFDQRVQFKAGTTPKTKQGDWADYLRGAVIALSAKYTISTGIAGVLDGTMPIGGLSSSAAVLLVFMQALCQANNLTVPPEELITMAVKSENQYVGVSSGRTDESCEMYSRRNHLLYFDTFDSSYELIPVANSMPPWKIMILFSGLERTLAGSKFNMRIDESRSAAYALMAFAGMEYGKFSEAYLHGVPRKIYEQYKDKLPETWRRRAEHWYTEQDRVESGREAWRQGDLTTFGKLIFASGNSSIVNWETGSPELKKIYDIMTRTDGIYGGRFSGAGFKGCCMALVHPDFIDSITQKITAEYLKEFPSLTGKFAIYTCDSSNGLLG